MTTKEDGKYLVSETDKTKLFVYFEEYKATQLLHIRYWYFDKKDETWKPGVKGIAIPEHNLKAMLDALRGLLFEMPAEAEPEPERDIYA